MRSQQKEAPKEPLDPVLRSEEHLISKNKYFDVDPWVFWPSAALILFFIGTTLIIGEPMNKVFAAIQDRISHNGGWFFILAVNFFLIFSLVMAITKYGNIRLGGRRSKPEFSRTAWFSMLFSAGMGIGILFWSVGEPVLHYVSPPYGAGETAQSSKVAMQVTFLHWGLHAWGIYALVGMALAFFTFNRKLPLTISSVFEPLIGNRIYGGWGKAINVLAVVATLFGLATSLGLGVQQVSAGLNHLMGVSDT
ncbi:MAG: BCCT family transporter, partial [Bacteroidales bacterium]